MSVPNEEEEFNHQLIGFIETVSFDNPNDSAIRIGIMTQNDSSRFVLLLLLLLLCHFCYINIYVYIA